MGVRFQNNFLQSGQKPAHQIGLEADLAKAKAKLVEYNYEMDILRAEERMLDKNQQLISSNNATELKAAMDFHKERLTAIRKSMLQNFGKSDELKNQITDIENQIKELGTKGREMTGEIIVTVKSDVATRANFSLSYLVSNAGWDPSYDLRVDDIKNPLQLVYKASVYQSTGEDWDKIQLNISTGNPRESSQAPILEPIRLPYNYSTNNNRAGNSSFFGILRGQVIDGQDGTPVPGVRVQIEGTSVNVMTDLDGRYQLNIPPNSGTYRISSSWIFT